MDTDALMTIGDFARRTWLSPRALRLYERSGLLVPAVVDPGSGYRRYAEEQLADARLIRSLRQLDMPLDQVAALIRLPADERAAVLEEHWRSVERELARQRFLSQHLRTLLTDERPPVPEITVRDVPAQLVLTEQRHLLASELPGWIDQALARQHREVPPGSGAGPSFVLYHGMVTEDSDGPAEVCTPVPDGLADRVSLPTRVEPAHREAFVPLTRAQVEYPQILSAYRAVAEWLVEQGLVQDGPAREVYLDVEDPDSDPMVEIAFPFTTGDAGPTS